MAAGGLEPPTKEKLEKVNRNVAQVLKLKPTFFIGCYLDWAENRDKINTVPYYLYFSLSIDFPPNQTIIQLTHINNF